MGRVGDEARVHHGLGEVVFGGQREGQRAEGGVEGVVVGGPVQGLEEGGVGPGAVGGRDQRLAHQAAACLPPVERVAVMGQQHQPVGGGERRVEKDRGGEAAQEGGDDALRVSEVGERPAERVLGAVEHMERLIAKLRAVGAVERQKDGDDGGLLEGLAGGGGDFLRQGQDQIGTFDAPAGGELGAGLRVPALELAEVAARRVLEHLAANPRWCRPARHGGRNRGRAPWHRPRRPPAV
jgi:hypothetical protein